FSRQRGCQHSWPQRRLRAWRGLLGEPDRDRGRARPLDLAPRRGGLAPMSSYPPPPPPQYPSGGQPGWGPPQGPVGDDRQATTALVLGILGLVICNILGPFAWVIGRNSVRRIDASGGQLGGRGKAQAGFILGIIATCFLIIGVIVAIIVIATSAGGSSSG